MEALSPSAPVSMAAGMQCSSLTAGTAPPSAAACAALTAAAAPPSAHVLPARLSANTSVSCDGSLASCCTELAVPVALPAVQHAAGPAPVPPPSCDSIDPAQRTHHLLKHCLSQSQRGAALRQFNTADPREAAKEIARMGQRELQAKFKDVYGSATKSNNNSWLRRKLYEAVGVAPLKASTKGKARKAASATASRKAHSSKDGKARPAKAAPKPRRPASELPASPQGGMSIFDYSDMLSAGTTASDSEDGCGSHGTFPASLHTSAPGTPRSSLGLPFAAGTLFSAQPQQLASLAPPAGFVPLPGMPQSEPQSPQASGLHWADGFSPVQQPPAAAPFLSATSRTLSMETGADGLSGLPGSAFKPMELEQDASWDAADLSGQPWYFGSSLDLSVLAPATLPVECGSSAACEEDDDIPLLTLDLGAIDVSI